MFDFSIVIPVYNSSNTIEALIENIEAELSGLYYEIILVNDGSRDNSTAICENIFKTKKNIKFINLRKNFGEFNAVMCGLNFVEGKYAILIDDDFQNPPSEILKLLEKAQNEDLDVVYSYYEEKKHHWFRNLGSELVNYLSTFLLKKPKNLYLSSFKIIKNEVVQEIVKYKGPHPYIDGLIFQVTQHVGKQKVEHRNRKDGNSNYSLRKLMSLFLTIVFGYSLLPLRLTFLAGFGAIMFSLTYMILYAFSVISEWGSPIVIFMCGTILCCLALMGEYLGNAFMHLNGKPQFVIRDVKVKNSNQI